MPRTTRYYTDWTNIEGDGQRRTRYRLLLIPADSASNALTAGATPSFGDTTGNAGWTYFDSAVVTQSTNGATDYGTGLPIGMPSAPTMTIGFDLSRLASSDLRTYLTEGPQTSGVSYAVPNASYTLSRPTTLVCRLYSDYGGGGTPSVIAFEGAVRPSPDRITVYNGPNDTAVREITFVSMLRAVLELVPPETLARHAYFNYYSSTNSYSIGDSFTELYDTIWDDGSTSYGVCAASGGTTSQRFKVKLFSLRALYQAIEDIATEVRRDYVRDSSVDVTFSASSVTTAQTSTGTATALDYVKVFEQGYDSSNTQGSAVAASTSVAYQSKDQLYFPAAIFTGADDLTIDTTDLGDEYVASDSRLVGGYFHPSDPDGIFGYADLYSLFVSLNTGPVKVSQSYFGDSLDVFFMPICGNDTSNRSEVDLQPVDIETDGEGEIAEGKSAGIVVAVRSPIPGAEGEDLSEVVVATDHQGVSGDAELGVDQHWSTSPHVGDPDDFIWQNPNEATLANQSFGGTHVSYYYARFGSRKLYYIDSPSFVSGDVPILVHDTITIHDGQGETSIGTVPENPELTDPASSGGGFASTSGNSTTHAANIETIRARALVRQKEAGLAYGTASVVGDLFSQARLWKTDLTVLRTNGRYDDLGNRYNLHSSSDVLTGLPILCPSALDAFSVYPKSGYCVGIAWEDGDLATVTLLGIPS